MNKNYTYITNKIQLIILNNNPNDSIKQIALLTDPSTNKKIGKNNSLTLYKYYASYSEKYDLNYDTNINKYKNKISNNIKKTLN